MLDLRWLVVVMLGAPALALQGGDEMTEQAGCRTCFEKHAGADFWGVVAVHHAGKKVFVGARGLADRQKTAITSDTFFDIGSVSKQFTAAAILKLEMVGKLSISDSIDKHFGDVPDDKRTITISQLLTHTSGIRSDLEIPDSALLKRDAMVEFVLGSRLVRKPGSNFEYSNVNYFLLAALVEVASRDEFEDFVEKAIFQPAKLHDTRCLGGDRWDRKRLTQRRALLAGAVKQTSIEDYPWNWAQRGATGVISTAEDLVRWHSALAAEGVLDAKAKEKLYTAPAGCNYALGWIVETTPRGTRRAYHGGSTMGYRALLVRYLEEDLVIAVLAGEEVEVSRLHELAECLIKTVFPGDPELPLPMKRPLSRANIQTGVYGLNLNGRHVAKGCPPWRFYNPEGAAQIYAFVFDPALDRNAPVADLYLNRDDASRLIDELQEQTQAIPSEVGAAATMELDFRRGDWPVSENGWISLDPVEPSVLPAREDRSVGLILQADGEQEPPLTVWMSPAAMRKFVDDLRAAL